MSSASASNFMQPYSYGMLIVFMILSIIWAYFWYKLIDSYGLYSLSASSPSDTTMAQHQQQLKGSALILTFLLLWTFGPLLVSGLSLYCKNTGKCSSD